MNQANNSARALRTLSANSGVLGRAVLNVAATTLEQLQAEIKQLKQDYRQAIGAAPGFLGDTLPEDAIRKGRGGE